MQLVKIHRVLLFLAVALLALSSLTRATTVEAQDDFLSRAAAMAQASQRETTVPASVTLAQAIIETSWGRKPVGDANNYFGIKAFARADGSVNYGRIAIGWVWATTKEWDGTQFIEGQARFRKYRSMEDSFRDHAYVLTDNPRYAEALRHADDPQEFARQIARAGYATAPSYDNDLIGVMDKYNLYQYDLKRDEAQVLSQSEFPTVMPGETFQIFFEVRNVGSSIWNQSEKYYLTNVNNIRFDVDERLSVPTDTPPQAIGRWTFNMTAPVSPGVYRTEWTLKHGDKNFGPAMHIDVTVASSPRNQLALSGLAIDYHTPEFVLVGSAMLGMFGMMILKKRRAGVSQRKHQVGKS